MRHDEILVLAISAAVIIAFYLDTKTKGSRRP